MKKPTKSIRHSRVRPRAALGWLLACFLLASQNMVAAFASQCDFEGGSTTTSSMAGMDHSEAINADPPAVPDCGHCHSHTQGHGCSGLHSCSAQLAASRAAPLMVHVGLTHASLILPATPRIVTMAVTPPLRPPAA